MNYIVTLSQVNHIKNIPALKMACLLCNIERIRNLFECVRGYQRNAVILAVVREHFTKLDLREAGIGYAQIQVFIQSPCEAAAHSFNIAYESRKYLTSTMRSAECKEKASSQKDAILR